MGTYSLVFNSFKNGVRGLFKVKSIAKTGTKIPRLTDEAWQNMSKAVFRDSSAPKSGFIAYLQDFENTLKNNSIYIPKDVQKSYSTLSDKANIFADRMSISISKGKTPQKKSVHHYFEKFQKKYSNEFATLEKYLKEQEQILGEKVVDQASLNKWKDLNNLKEYLRNLGSYNSKYHINDLYDSRIAELGQNIINPQQSLFHGTHAQRHILKEGFSLTPKATQAKSGAREIGKAVYLTPDKEVASFFAGIRGNIIKTKVNIDKIAVMNIEQANLIGKELAKIYKLGNIDPALHEEVIAELFKRNGFNAVYTKGCLNDGLGKMLGGDIDKFIGHPQTQLAVFNPNRINICKKSIEERLYNQALQIKTKWNFLKQFVGNFCS